MPAPTDPQKTADHPMLAQRLGFCAWSVKPDGIDSLIHLAQRIGVHTVQLPMGWVLDHPKTWRDAPARLSDNGITLASGMISPYAEDYTTLQTIAQTGGLVPDEHWNRNLDTLRKSAEVAEAFGLSRVSLHAGFIPDDSDAPAAHTLLDRLRTAGDVCRDHGQRLLLETGQETAEGLTAFLDRLDHPALGVNFDPANMILYGKGDPIQALRTLLPRVEQVHLKDAVPSDRPGEAWGQEVRLGDGAVDWPAFFEVLSNSGFDGPMLVEREAGDSRFDDIHHAIDLVRRLHAPQP